MCLAVHSQYFSPVAIICPLIHNILCPLSSPVEIVDSIFLPVEVNNSTVELYLPVDSQCSSPVGGRRREPAFKNIWQLYIFSLRDLAATTRALSQPD